MHRRKDDPKAMPPSHILDGQRQENTYPLSTTFVLISLYWLYSNQPAPAVIFLHPFFESLSKSDIKCP